MPLFYYGCDKHGDCVISKRVPDDYRLKKPSLKAILCEPEPYDPKVHIDKGPQKLCGLSGDWYITEPRICTMSGKWGVDTLTGDLCYDVLLRDQKDLVEKHEYIAQDILGIPGTCVYVMRLPPGTVLESVKFYYRGFWFTHTVKPESTNGS